MPSLVPPSNAVFTLPKLRDYQWPVLTSEARDDVTISAPQLGKTVALGLWDLIGAYRDAEAGIRLPSWWTAPTYKMAENGLEKLAGLAESSKILRSFRFSPSMRVVLSNGGIIEARSWDVPENLYGPTVARIAIDEFGFLTREAYVAFRSRVAETRVRGMGFMRYAGNVGEIGGEAEALWRHALSGAPGWACRVWTWRNRAEAAPCCCDEGKPLEVALDAESIARHGIDCERGLYLSNILDAKNRMSDAHFRQLYGAEFVDWASLPAYTFDRQVHSTTLITEYPSLGLDLSCDFNVDPMAWIVGQHTAREAWDFDEIIIPGGATTRAACAEFLRRYPARNDRDLTVYGDASGNSGSTKSNESDYDIIKQELLPKWPRLSFSVPASNPAVTSRLNSVNAMLSSGDGKIVRYFVHPRCEVLANDFVRVSLKPGTREIDKRNKNLTHASDAAGYRLVSLFPVALDGVELVAIGPPASGFGFDGGVATMEF